MADPKPTQGSAQDGRDSEARERAAFEAEYAHLDLTKQIDSWQGIVYKHSHVDAMWEARKKSSARNAARPAPEALLWHIMVAGPAGYVRREAFAGSSLAEALENVRKQGFAWVEDEDSGFPDVLVKMAAPEALGAAKGVVASLLSEALACIGNLPDGPQDQRRHALIKNQIRGFQAIRAAAQSEAHQGIAGKNNGFGQHFECWWEKDGQFVRAGGGDYEKSFAHAAWNAVVEECARIANNKYNVWDEGIVAGQEIAEDIKEQSK
ncbi:hypothetical protein QTN24_15365 [Cupriavidus sp. SZY C1]|uniref:hypothetical protein n=1 Tax=Cupriavidus sp. SZY C1 TaxID=3055037 RepID=UPI0028BCAB9A|nr:hypothetical protein [Cupriavidus sp. SZY C1]MDT6962878.1 hypothetical protein [Cupriavidus sp. SZY C1]